MSRKFRSIAFIAVLISTLLMALPKLLQSQQAADSFPPLDAFLNK